MNNDDLLDNDEWVTQSQQVWGTVRWWEKRRLYYNLLVGITGVITIFILFSKNNVALPNINTIVTALLIACSFYGIMANLAYTSGWVFEILLKYYFNLQLDKSTHQVIWWIGTIFSILLTLAISSLPLV